MDKPKPTTAILETITISRLEYTQARDAIAAMQWIKCTDKLPELGDYSVLACWSRNGGMDMVYVKDYFKEVTAGLDADGNQLYTMMFAEVGITHWMPLPLPPQPTGEL